MCRRVGEAETAVRLCGEVWRVWEVNLLCSIRFEVSSAPYSPCCFTTIPPK